VKFKSVVELIELPISVGLTVVAMKLIRLNDWTYLWMLST